MSGCHPIEMPVCGHLVPVKFPCQRCTNEGLAERVMKLEQRLDKLIDIMCSTLGDDNANTRR